MVSTNCGSIYRAVTNVYSAASLRFSTDRAIELLDQPRNDIVMKSQLSGWYFSSVSGWGAQTR